MSKHIKLAETPLLKLLRQKAV
ncbi:hypothetical protein VTO73DRAFT_15082 [Trametes versicolor]